MNQPSQERTWYEEFTVTGTQLLDQVKKLIAEGNVRRVFIKNQDGRTLLKIPLTAGVAITAVTSVLAPALVAVGAIAAMLTQVTIGVEREHRGASHPNHRDEHASGQGAPGERSSSDDPDRDEPPALGHA